MAKLTRFRSQADTDPLETAEWLESLQSVLENQGPERVSFLLQRTERGGPPRGGRAPLHGHHALHQHHPGRQAAALSRQSRDRAAHQEHHPLERDGHGHRGPTRHHDGIGGHISTFASAATLYEVAFNHFFQRQGRRLLGRPDLLPGARLAGHLRPGVSRRPADRAAPGEFPPGAGRRRRAVELSAPLADARLLGVPDRVDGPGADHGHLPGPLQQVPARPRHQEHQRPHVWAFLGDGETDEPETLGAITLAGREELDNLIFVINCNLQRLDGPVRGNGKIIQELEGIFRGAGWNVIKVIWGDDWDPLLAKDKHGLLVQRMGEVVDGEYQKYTVMPGAYIREHFFGKYPELEQMVRALSDEELKKLRRGGHDPEKVYAAYKAAVETQGQADRDPGQDDQGLRPGRRRAKDATSRTSRRS